MSRFGSIGPKLVIFLALQLNQKPTLLNSLYWAWLKGLGATILSGLGLLFLGPYNIQHQMLYFFFFFTTSLKIKQITH